MRYISLVVITVFFGLQTGPVQAADKTPKEKPGNKTTETQTDYLAKPVRLHFKLIPEEEEDNVFSVLCAGGKYVIRSEGKGEEPGNAHKYQFAIDGQALPTDDPGQIRLTFKVKVSFEYRGKEEKNAHSIRAEGSTVIASGKTVTLAELGERRLIVEVTPADKKLKPMPVRDEDDDEDEDEEAPVRKPEGEPGDQAF